MSPGAIKQDTSNPTIAAMKEICQCNCSVPAAAYRTPWCNLLCGGREPIDILHLWYKLSVLREEVEKRSSYLGKCRRTEESKHLLDLIAMTVDEEDLFVPYAKEAMGDVFDVLHTYMPKREKALFWREGKETAVFTDDPEPPDPPVKFYAGQYVEYNGKLYMAIEDGDSDDFEGKLVPTEDYRDSIHYGLNWRCCGSNINAVEPLDTAIFEALVARIIYKWLCVSYPDESKHYLEEYNEHLEAIRRRCNILNGPQIVSRIPRIF